MRIAASIKHGHATASLLVQRLQAHPNRSQFARALQEYGRIMLDQLKAEGKSVPPELQRHFSPTLNAHINKIGKFDIDPNRGSPLRDLIQPGELAAGTSFH